MNQTVIAFLKKLAENQELHASFEGNPEKLLAFALENGLSLEDIQSLTSAELDDKALEVVAGGAYVPDSDAANQITAMANLMLKNNHLANLLHEPPNNLPSRPTVLFLSPQKPD